MGKAYMFLDTITSSKAQKFKCMFPDNQLTPSAISIQSSTVALCATKDPW